MTDAKRRIRQLTTGVVGAAFIFGAMGAQGGCSGTSTGTAGKSSAAPDDGASTAAAKPAKPVASKPIVLLNIKGNGQHQTQKFTAHGDWDMAYTYNCANFGYQGNFAVTVYGSDGNISLANDGPNELGMKGSGVDHEHHGGTYYLAVNSECRWTLKVTG